LILVLLPFLALQLVGKNKEEEPEYTLNMLIDPASAKYCRISLYTCLESAEKPL
jgi:hypothetical protein